MLAGDVTRMRILTCRIVLICAVVCATLAGASFWPTAYDTRTEDRNGDGRPDVWRHFNSHGQPTDVRIDTNFDGRSDVQEYYEGGTLVRRESDRNFDDQVDLIEEFDTATREHVRAIVDTDYDGTADVLVLFAEGRPVFSRPLPPVVVEARHGGDESVADWRRDVRRGDDRLVPLRDPSDGELSIRSVHVTSHSDGGVSGPTSTGMVPSSVEATSPHLAPAQRVPIDQPARILACLSAASPRGPPHS
jgi:hypothetical protein